MFSRKSSNPGGRGVNNDAQEDGEDEAEQGDGEEDVGNVRSDAGTGVLILGKLVRDVELPNSDPC